MGSPFRGLDEVPCNPENHSACERAEQPRVEGASSGMMQPATFPGWKVASSPGSGRGLNARIRSLRLPFPCR